MSLDALRKDYDAVFLGIGLGGVNALRAVGEDLDGVRDAVDFIAELRQTKDLSKLAVGRDVVVIGGGYDGGGCGGAIQASGGRECNHRLPARTGQDGGQSPYEQDHAVQAGVRIIHNAAPVKVLGRGPGRGRRVCLYG